ncbi:TIGR02265 family protein [Hyalangium versicolor]|uniref:TIGR02265 family protein n=1 Tax=Hyalangium versicolor TaxID=2861190 RepID=UPI001CC92746|nr:TIGR02265 family protein [Hyalangium versicolor]
MDSSLNLQARLKRCRPAHLLMGLFFQGTLDHLERLIGSDVTGELRAQVRSTEKPVLPVLFYPVGDYLKLLQLGAQALVERGRSFSAALDELGYGTAEALFASSMGQMLVVAAEKGPHEGFAELPAVLKMIAIFGAREYQRVDETHGRLSLRGELQGPSWSTGLLRAVLERVVGGEGTVEVGSETFIPYLDFTLELRWG